MADVRKRRDRKGKPWIADYLDANRRRHRIAAETKEAAQLLLAEKTKESRERGPTVGNPDITLKDYAAKWLPRIEPDLKHKSRVSYRYAFGKHIIPDLGKHKLRDLSRPLVKWFLDQKREAKLAKASISFLKSVLSSMLSEALEDGIVTRNVALSTGRKKRKATTQGQGDPTASVRPLAENEVAALLEAAPDEEYRTVFMVLVRAGLRPGEMLGLKWTDFNFTDRQILVERAIEDGHIDTPKSGRSRLVDMSQGLAAALSQLYIQREREQLQGIWGERGLPPWVFCGSEKNGEPLDIDKVRYRFHRALKKAGTSGHMLYDLRHTFASTLLAKGAPITYVAAQMGHSNANITLKHYARWIPSADRSFVDSLDILEHEAQPRLAPLYGTTRESEEEKPSILRGFQSKKTVFPPKQFLYETPWFAKR